MRTNDVLVNGFENMKILFQYLYMNEEHYVEVTNSVDVKLRITMNDYGLFKVLNMNFPKLDPVVDVDKMDVLECMAIIRQLEEQSPLMENAIFKNRWEEIKTITNSTVFMNREQVKRRFY